jgi:hypothetical protein
VGVRSIASVVSRERTAGHRGLAGPAGWAGAGVVSGTGMEAAPVLTGAPLGGQGAVRSLGSFAEISPVMIRRWTSSATTLGRFGD